MLKKIICCSAVSLLIMGNSYANNFYAGAGAGYEFADFNRSVSVTNTVTNYSFNNKDYLAGDGALGNIFAGYEWDINQMYLAAELNGAISSLQYKTTVNSVVDSVPNSAQSKISLRQRYGVSLLPGIQMGDHLIAYGRVGYSRVKFNYSTNINNAGYVTSASQGEWLNGIRYGVGVGTPLSENAGLRLEFDQTRYNNFKRSATSTPIGQTSSVSVKPVDNQVELDFVYHFKNMYI